MKECCGTWALMRPLPEGEATSPGMLTTGAELSWASCLNIFVHSGDLIWSSSLLRKEQNGKWFNIATLGVPTLCAATGVMAFILDCEITVVLFLKIHLRVLGKWELFLWTSRWLYSTQLLWHFLKRKLKHCFKRPTSRSHVTSDELS